MEDQFVADADKVASAKYHFIVALEACIDLCNHLISRNSFRVPEDYGDTFRVMAEVGALSPEFAELLVSMGKFRNRWCTFPGELMTARCTSSWAAACRTSGDS
jgi:uncharacterized protein YutE (UPF0331/DUF86 family)